jgi:hypothetical protein
MSKAEAAFRRAVELKPDFTEAHCALSVSSTRRQPKEAFGGGPLRRARTTAVSSSPMMTPMPVTEQAKEAS